MAPIKIATANADGIRRKVGAIKNFLIHDGIEILAICETKTPHPFKLGNFIINSRNCKSPNSGGVAIVTHPNLNCIPFNLPSNFKDLETIASTLFINNINITLFAYYNRPHEKINIQLIEFFAHLPYAILMGDLNARHTDFGDTSCNRNGNDLVSLMTGHPFTRLTNKNPTFINYRGSSIVDHILITESLISLFNTECSIGTTITSDHLPLVTELNISRPKPPPSTILIPNINKTNWPHFIDYMTNKTKIPTESTDPATIDTQIIDLTSTITNAQQIFTPSKIVHTLQNTLPNTLIQLIKHKRKIYRLFCRTRDPSLKTEFNRLNAQIRRDINSHNQSKWINACSQLDYRDGAKFWNKLKKLTGQKTTTTPPLLDNNLPITDPLEKANLFATTLQHTYRPHAFNEFDTDFLIHVTKTNNALLPSNHPSSIGHNTFTNPIEPDDVKNIIMTLKNNKAPGPDAIKAPYFKNLPENTIKALTTIYNNCLLAGYFPTHFKTSQIIMIPKPGKPKTNPNNFRPIALLNISGKIFEKILSHRLKLLIDTHSLLPAHQHGFRSQHTTMDSILRLHTETIKHTNFKRITIAAFLDVEKAFDRVWHDGLVYKLGKLQLSNTITQLIKSFLINRTGTVKIGSSQSVPFPIKAGVPQGSVLSPLLFNLYVADIPTTDNTNTLMFADDTAIWSSHHNPITAHKNLQTHLELIHTWTQNWRISLNPSKSKAIAFSNLALRKLRRRLPNNKLTINNTPIPMSNQTKYLGITLTNSSSLNNDLKTTLSKIRQRASILKLINCNYKGCNPDTLLHTYKTFIRPLIDYRAPLYASINPSQQHRILSTERRILRYILRLPYRFPSNQLYTYANLQPITDRLTHLQQRFIHRAINNNSPSNSTLLTPFYITPTNRQLPKLPKKKSTFPPTALLSKAYPDLPDEHQEALEEIPLILRAPTTRQTHLWATSQDPQDTPPPGAESCHLATV